MARKGDQVIRSYPELDRVLDSIVDHLEADRELALAALSNPLLALQELGYEVEPQARQEVEDRLRFRPETGKQVHELRQRLFEQAGRSFDPRSDQEVERVLFDELGLPRGTKLEKLADKHPVVKSLVEYRRLDASEPRFGTPEVYASIRKGERKLPITGLRAVRRKRG